MNFADKQLPSAIKHISRKTHQGFNLIPGQVVEDHVYEESNFLSELFIL
jgi:calmodulin-lysine N-methyltransferase